MKILLQLFIKKKGNWEATSLIIYIQVLSSTYVQDAKREFGLGLSLLINQLQVWL